MKSQYSRPGRIRADRVPKGATFANKKASVLAAGTLLGISAVLIACVGSVGTLAAEDHPPLLLDLSQLKLNVSSSEVTPSLCDMSGGCVFAKEGEQKLVVVTLSGFLQKPSMVSLLANDFAATPADSSFWRTSDRSVGINLNGIWTLDKGNQAMGIVAVPFSASGPIAIKVAFLLKMNTSEFFVSYPAFVVGRASVSAIQKQGK
ncbi:MAG: hypothetical protein LAQ69_23800 [Acidobacteriia bacterium]|nr:hypothetical protein [Terriglobia bacterium]